MNTKHATFGENSLVESPRESLATPDRTKVSHEDHGIAVRNFSETFPDKPTPPKKGSGHKCTSIMSVSKFYQCQPCFCWFYGRDGANTQRIPKPEEDIPKFSERPLFWADQLSDPRSSSSHVYAMVCKSDHCSSDEKEYVAVKEVECSHDEGRNAALNELYLLSQLKHKHIIACVGGYFYDEQLCIIQYPVAKYNLAKFLQARSHYLQFKLGDEERERDYRAQIGTYFSCLCNTLRYLYDSGIKHRDVKPENILIDKENSIILTDFDRSRTNLKTLAKTEDATPCTVRYSCRQVCQGKPRDFSSDVFSLGCVFLEMANVMLGKQIREMYENLGITTSSGFELAYWESVQAGKVERWIGLLSDISREIKQDYDSSSVVSHSSGDYVLNANHLDTIKRMMSDDSSSRPKLDEVHQIFSTMRGICDECKAPNLAFTPTILERNGPPIPTSSRTTLHTTSITTALRHSGDKLEGRHSPDLPTIIETGQTPTSVRSSARLEEDPIEGISDPASRIAFQYGGKTRAVGESGTSHGAYPKLRQEGPSAGRLATSRDPHSEENKIDTNAEIRLWRPGKPTHVYTDVNAIPGHRVIQYDPEVEKFQVVPKEQIDFNYL
ncbi:kinase-like protein [Lojkania enalia]|uniref:non-specific serine/threonine protein kinase n=1 Tax=Lojkania enalia TaxID=147567 RepID=A0A9P4TPK7_9PLEO|nr:kinase-like protein [Didymosphaeria enalia]